MTSSDRPASAGCSAQPSFASGYAPRSLSGTLRPVRAGTAGFCRPDARPARLSQSRDGDSLPFSPPTAGDKQRPMPDRQGWWPLEKPVRALVSSWLAPLDRHVDFGGVERCRKPLLFTVVARAIPKAWPSNTGRAMSPDNVPVGVLADHVIKEQVLGDNGIAFHAHHLGDVGDAPGAVAQT